MEAKEKVIKLNPNQVWFIKCALSLKNEVLPLHESALSDKIFKEDYGLTKKEMERELRNLERNLTI